MKPEKTTWRVESDGTYGGAKVYINDKEINNILNFTLRYDYQDGASLNVTLRANQKESQKQ